jgi:hypothetical protein
MKSSLRSFQEADRVRELDVPDDLNIAEDEFLQYGSPQFNDSQIILPNCNEEGFYRWEQQKEETSSSCKSHLSQLNPTQLNSTQLIRFQRFTYCFFEGKAESSTSSNEKFS